MTFPALYGDSGAGPRLSKMALVLTFAMGLSWNVISPVSAADTRATLDVDGQKRTLRIIEPTRLKKTPRSTIIVFHAGSGSVGGVRRSLGLDVFARQTGAILVYPSARNNRWEIGSAGEPPTNDMQFIRAIVNRLVADGSADRRKIYLAGVSSGAMLAMRLACESTDLFAGAAALISTLPPDLASACKPAKPLPFLLINGTADPMVPYQGGKASLVEYKGDLASTEATLAPFLSAAGCGAPRPAQEVPDRDPKDGSRAMIERYTGCKAAVQLVRVEGGGHTVPGRRTLSVRGAVVGAQNNDLDAARMVFNFFRNPPPLR